MLAALVALIMLVAWCLVGVAALRVMRADLGDLRTVLTAPAVGTAVTVLPLFVLSNFGVPMGSGGPPVVAVLLAGSLAVVVWRRPRLPLTALPVLCVCLVEFALVGRPLFEFGFHWIANANGDMSYYVLSATGLTDHGLRSPVDVNALARGHDYPSTAQYLILGGVRPGTQITLAGVAAMVGRHPLDLYMAMILAIGMCGLCAAGALALQGARRWWAAPTAAALLVISPMAGYGLLQQLLPQVWGLGLATALFAWLLRADIHRRSVALFPDLAAITILAAGLFIVYTEIAASLAVAYLLYVVILAARRQLAPRALALLWGVPVAATALITNAWLPKALHYLHAVVSFGTGGGSTGLPIFGYAVVPTALVGLTGLREIFSSPQSPHMGVAVAGAAVLLLATMAIALCIAAKGAAAGVAVLGYLVVGLLLARNNNQFGLLKLYMYVQPFVAATLAVWLSFLNRRLALAVTAVIATVAAVQVATLNAYVEKSFNPIDLRNASAADLVPTFRATVSQAHEPVVSVVDNFALTFIEGSLVGDKTVYFLGRNLFMQKWPERTIPVPSGKGAIVNVSFAEDTSASRALGGGRCVVLLPSGSQIAINRRISPEGSPNLEKLHCGAMHERLAFMPSSLGQPATLPDDRHVVSFWQLEPDTAFARRTFSGFGRYALFQILGPPPRHVRLALDFTATPIRDPPTSRLPPAAVVGRGRVTFPVVGSGSARVISPPLEPVIVNGRPYVVLDMGRGGRFPRVPRPGLTGLWGKSVLLDSRLITSYVRDVSLVPDAAYRSLAPPAALRTFPADLGNEQLQYSGVYEDGWVSRDSYFVLAGRGARALTIHADVLPLANQRVELVVDGHSVGSKAVQGGTLDWTLAVPPSARARSRIELRWAKAAPIGPRDPRPAAAHLSFLGFARAATRIADAGTSTAMNRRPHEPREQRDGQRQAPHLWQ